MYYIVDSSSLMKLDEHYPSDLFDSLWDLFYSLFDNNEIESVKEVWKELRDSQDYWKHYEYCFRDLDDSESENLSKIMSYGKFEDFIKNGLKQNKDVSWADPHLIACAMNHEKGVIITEENLNNNPTRKIPYVCKELNKEGYNIECINLLDFLREKGVKFNISLN